MAHLSHTARLLRAVQQEYAIHARSEARDGKLHDSQRIAEVTNEYLLWLREQMHKQPET